MANMIETILATKRPAWSVLLKLILDEVGCDDGCPIELVVGEAVGDSVIAGGLEGDGVFDTVGEGVFGVVVGGANSNLE